MNQFKYFLYIIAVAIFFNSCKDDEDLFAGTDNFITAFSLTKGQTIYNASFYNDSIIITAPEDVSLKGAVVNYLLSEHASILPLPDSVSNWNNEMLFRVTSYDGKDQTYKYVVSHGNYNTEGTVILGTQAEVDAFGTQNNTEIKGSLIIGRLGGNDSITSLSSLYPLKKIGYNLIIRPTYTGSEFTGLESLESVGGRLDVSDVNTLTELNFQSLKTLGGLTVDNDSITSIKFPVLTAITGDVTMGCPLDEFSVPNLKTISGKFFFSHNTSDGLSATIKKLYFPMLQEVGDITLRTLLSVGVLQMPELVKCGGMEMTNMNNLSFFYFPKLQESTGKIHLPVGSNLSEVSFPSLKKAASLTITSGNIITLNFPVLSEVTDDLYLQKLDFQTIQNGFSSLKTVGGKFSLYDVQNIGDLELLSITSIGEFYLYNSYNSETFPTSVNVKGIQLGRLSLEGSTSITKITGDDQFRGTLFIRCQFNDNVFPEFEGFSEVDSLNIGNNGSLENIEMPNLTKINNGAYIATGSRTTSLSFSNLESVGNSFEIVVAYDLINTVDFSKLTSISGDFEFSANFFSDEKIDLSNLSEIGGNFTLNTYSVTDDLIEFPAVRTIGGNLNYISNGNIDVNTTLSFPLLESIQGSLNMETGFFLDWSAWGLYYQYCLYDFSFPELTSIGKNITITSGQSDYTNTRLISLNGFGALTTIGGNVTIVNQEALTSYSGLKNAIESISIDNWTVSGNGYNPTYQDLSNGNWSE